MPYRNAIAMADWLSAAYGFEKRRVVKSASGAIRCAQLDFGDGSVMVVPVQDPTSERPVAYPGRIGGVEAQTCYLVVSDIDGHYAKTTSSGAEIVSGIAVDEFGGRSYASRDPEGHIWTFGTYDPRENRDRDPDDKRRRRNLRLGVPLLSLALFALAVSVSVAVWTFTHMMSALESDVLRFAQQQRSARQGVERDAKNLADELLQVRMAKATTERDVAGLATQLSQARTSLEVALENEKEARSLLAKEVRAKEGLARTAKQTADQLGQERIAREAAEKAAKDATDLLTRVRFATAERVTKDRSETCEPERKSRLLAEHSVQDAQAELARERSARAAAEIAATELRNQLASLGTGHQGIFALRDQVEAERRAKEGFERVAKDAQLLLAQEKYSRDSTERALKHAQERLAAASCWACPGGTPCARP
jgi:uncharacterized glyoxalase superfamily protein PhnB